VSSKHQALYGCSRIQLKYLNSLNKYIKNSVLQIVASAVFHHSFYENGIDQTVSVPACQNHFPVLIRKIQCVFNSLSEDLSDQ
jgi:hypothetical protein